MGVNIGALTQTMREIVGLYGGYLSLRKLANNTRYSYHTVGKAVEYLKNAHVLDYVLALRIKGGNATGDLKSHRRMYFLDPLVLYAATMDIFGIYNYRSIQSIWQTNTNRRLNLIASLLYNHLRRWGRSGVYYIRRGERTLDFIAFGEKNVIALEIYPKKKRSSGIFMLGERILGKKVVKIIVTEDELILHGDVYFIPYPIFLLALEQLL